MLQVNPIPQKMLRHIKYIITCLVHILEHVLAALSTRNGRNLLEPWGRVVPLLWAWSEVNIAGRNVFTRRYSACNDCVLASSYNTTTTLNIFHIHRLPRGLYLFFSLRPRSPFLFQTKSCFFCRQRKADSCVAGEACVCVMQGVSGGIVNILGGGSMDYSE